MNDKWIGAVVKEVDNLGASVSASTDGVEITIDFNESNLRLEPDGARWLAALLMASAGEVERLRKETPR